MFDVLNATDFVVPALEILDTRIERVDPATKATRKIFDTIADNAANAGIVLGGRPLRPLDADLRWIGALCYRNGQLEETGLAAGVLNHPATAVAWLANKIAPLGLALEPGQVVLAGSFIRPIETRKGDTIQADYGPYGIGQLLLRLMPLEQSLGVIRTCRISRSNIPPISMPASTWPRWSKSCARPRWKPAFFRSAAFASAPSAASITPSPTAIRDFGFLAMLLRLGEGRDLADPQEGRRTYLQGAVQPISIRFSPDSKFALSFDMQINDKETSWKRNNIHEALKAEAAHG